MKKLPDSPKSSLQRLRPILAGALQNKFSSRLRSKKKQRSEEIVNTIVLELETYLVDLTSETIDQVSGRLETRLNDLFSSSSGSKSSSEKPELQDEDVEAVKEDLSSSAQEGDSDLIDAVCRVLNGINKENKLKKLRKYLQKEADRKKSKKEKSKKKTDKKADKKVDKEAFDTLKASFDSGGYEAFFKIILNIDDICKQTSKVLEKTVAKHMQVQREINNTLNSVVKKLDRARAVHRRLDKSIAALAKSNLALAYSRVKLALINIALAISNVALAASNFILAAAIIVYAVSMLIYASAMILKAATQVILAVVIAVMYLLLAAVIIAFSIVAAAILIVGIALVIGFMIVLAAALLIMILTVAVVLALVFVSLVIALALMVVTAAVFALSLIVSVALVIAAGLVVAAAVAAVVVASALLLGTILDVAIIAITAELASLAGVIGLVAYALFKLSAVILIGFTAVSLAIVGVIGGATFAAVAAVGVLLMAAIAGFAALFAASQLALGAISGLLVIMFALIVYSLMRLFLKGRDTLMKWWEDKGRAIWEDVQNKYIPMVDNVVNLIDSWIMGGEDGEKSVWDKIMDHLNEVESVGLFKYIDNRAREQPKSSTMGKVVDAVDKMDTSNCDKLGQQLQNMEGDDGYVKKAENWVSKTWDFIKKVLSSLTDGLRWVEDKIGNYGVYGWIMENVTQATMGYSRQQELLDKKYMRDQHRLAMLREGKREEDTKKARSLYDKVRIEFPLEDAIDSLSPEAALKLDMVELTSKPGGIGKGNRTILREEKSPNLKAVWNLMKEIGLYTDKTYDEVMDLYLDRDSEFMKYYDAMCARLDHMRAAYEICVTQVNQNVPKTVDAVLEKAKEKEKQRKVDSEQEREKLMKEREERRKKQK